MFSLNQLWEKIENWMSSDETEDHQFSNEDLDPVFRYAAP